LGGLLFGILAGLVIIAVGWLAMAGLGALLGAEIAILIYDRLAEFALESFLISSMLMLLRAAMIAELAAIPGHPVLDINCVINWFFHSLKMSPDKATKKAANWRNCSIE
jgi:hypothetical protein